jgi:K+-transporting ATPase ATPase A chain
MLWIFPAIVFILATLLAIPLGYYQAWIFDTDFRPPRFLAWFERRVDTGPQKWKAYLLALLTFNVVAFLVGFAVLALQPFHPHFLNPDSKGMLAPSTMFNTMCSFLSNTNLQHYSGEVHLSYGSQLFAIAWSQFISPVIGLAALVAMIRGLRGDAHMGNFYLDMWRGVVYLFLPLSLIVAVMLMACGMPMTMQGAAHATTIEAGAMGAADNGAAKPQDIARGPVAAIVAIKQLGTNGGGFFGVNSAHPFENPNAWSNLIECICIIMLPIAGLVTFGRMLRNMPHARVIYGVMFVLSLATVVWAIDWDTARPNPALTGQKAGTPYAIAAPKAKGGVISLPVDAIPGLPVDQSLGNLEGKELRFGTSAGATWAALTTNTSNGSANSNHDSLNPLACITPLTGMWLNCIWGGVGVGLINLLVYLIVGVFLAGLMVGRTPEYLGKKVEAREMKLASLAMLIHPLMILIPAGLFVATDWGLKTEGNPGAHGFYELVYEFTSASANNGSECGGVGNTYGFNNAADNPSPPAIYAVPLDIATGLVMLISRFIPIIAPVAIAGYLALKRPTPFTVGTLRTDTITFGFVLLGTILLVGALLFLPAAVLGPVAEHLGPIPFGG